MIKNNAKIWIWIHNNKILKTIFCPEDGTLLIFDGFDNMLIKRTGLTSEEMNNIEFALSALGAKKLDRSKEPFIYL